MTITKKIQGDHLDHEHQFQIQNYKKQFTCDGCKEPGFGSRYRCDFCDYDLHKECKNPKPTITHDFFKGSTFDFFKEPQLKLCADRHCKERHPRCCDGCGKKITGFSYQCKQKRYDLHPCCSNLKGKLTINGTVFELCEKGSSKCEWCKKKKLSGNSSKIPGWSYVSTREKCHFHVHCVTEMVHEAWKRGDIDEINSMALERMDFGLVRNSGRNGGRGSVFWRTVKIFLKTIISILVGDPTTILASVFVELFS